MRLLFEMIEPNLEGLNFVRRDSVRGIIIKDKKVALVYSKLYNYYKFPGGGFKEGESAFDCLAREVREEAGLKVIKGTEKEFGMVDRRHISTTKENTCFLQDNFYYFCEVEEEPVSQDLDEYEDKEGFTLVYIDPRLAIKTNREENHGPKSKSMLEREALVLELLIKEGYFD